MASRAVSWDPGSGPSLVLLRVPADTFVMGFADSADESPVHTQRVDEPYYLGRDPVTWAHYLAFCAATGHRTPAEPAWGTPPDHPVVGVSHPDAVAYCEWAGLRLPTEAEWELAARGPDGRMYPWGDEEPSEFSPNDLCVTWTHPIYGTEAHATTASVDADLPDVSPYGVRQMAGNVSEWVGDAYEERAYDRYVGGDFSAPVETADALRVVRGTNWQGASGFARSAYRLSMAGEIVSPAFGFRIAIDAGKIDTGAGDRSQPLDLRPATPGRRLSMDDLVTARAALADGDFPTALAAGRRSLASAPTLVAAHRIVAEALIGLAQPGPAAEAYEAAVAACPHNSSLLAYAAQALHAAGRASDALKIQRRVAAERPEDDGAVINELITCWSAGQYTDAAAIGDQLLARGVDQVPVRLVRALARFELDDMAGTLEDLDAHLAVQHDDTAARNIRGDVLAAMDRSAEATAAYEDVLRRLDDLLAGDPDDADVRGRKAYTLLALGRPSDALTEALRASQAAPTDALALRSIGRANLMLGDATAAVEALRAARELEPERIEVLYDLARALAESGSPAEARFRLGRPLRLSPRLAAAARADKHLAPLLPHAD